MRLIPGAFRDKLQAGQVMTVRLLYSYLPGFTVDETMLTVISCCSLEVLHLEHTIVLREEDYHYDCSYPLSAGLTMNKLLDLKLFQKLDPDWTADFSKVQTAHSSVQMPIETCVMYTAKSRQVWHQ